MSEIKSKPDRYDDFYTHEEPVRCTQPGYEHRWICRGCAEEGHVQGPTDEFHDCKVVFLDANGKSLGQCMCYSEAHGRRDK